MSENTKEIVVAIRQCGNCGAKGAPIEGLGEACADCSGGEYRDLIPDETQTAEIPAHMAEVARRKPGVLAVKDL